MKSKINTILDESLSWLPSKSKKSVFITDTYDENICWLKKGNFPAESQWILHYKTNNLYFDELPAKWSVKQ